jgi:hypothetical protein
MSQKIMICVLTNELIDGHSLIDNILEELGYPACNSMTVGNLHIFHVSAYHIPTAESIRLTDPDIVRFAKANPDRFRVLITEILAHLGLTFGNISIPSPHVSDSYRGVTIAGIETMDIEEWDFVHPDERVEYRERQLVS